MKPQHQMSFMYNTRIHIFVSLFVGCLLLFSSFVLVFVLFYKKMVLLLYLVWFDFYLSISCVFCPQYIRSFAQLVAFHPDFFVFSILFLHIKYCFSVFTVSYLFKIIFSLVFFSCTLNHSFGCFIKSSLEGTRILFSSIICLILFFLILVSFSPPNAYFTEQHPYYESHIYNINNT